MGGKKMNLDDLDIMATDKSFLKRRENGLMLGDNDVEILKNNNIDYLKCKSLSELLFYITLRLEEVDNDELSSLSIKLGEYNYYNYTNK